MEGYCSTGQSPQRAVVPVEQKKKLCLNYFYQSLAMGPLLIEKLEDNNLCTLHPFRKLQSCSLHSVYNCLLTIQAQAVITVSRDVNMENQ
jgi:hypothetical protein